MSYQLVYEEIGFIIKFSGVVSINELNEGNGAIHGHKEFDTHRYQIVDLREADLTGVLLADAQEPAAMDVIAAATNTSVRITLVVSDAYAFIVSQEFANQSKEMGSPWEYSIFYDYNEALIWAKNITNQ